MYRILKITGNVLWFPNPKLASPHWLPARPGMIINLSGGEVVKTCHDSGVLLESLDDGKLTGLSPNSILGQGGDLDLGGEAPFAPAYKP